MSIFVPIYNLIVKLQFASAARTKFYETLTEMVDGGISAYDSVCRLHAAYSKNGKRNWEPKAIILSSIAQRMRSDDAKFAPAAAPWISQYETALLVASEESGNLATGLSECVVMLEAQTKMRQAVVKGTTYPAVMLTMLWFMLQVVAIQLIPSLMTGRDPNRLMGSSAALYDLSQFANNYSTIVATSIIVVVVAVYLSMSRWTGRSRLFMDNLPSWTLVSIPYQIYKMRHGTIFMVNISILRRSGGGKQNIDHIHLLSESANPWLKERLHAVASRLRMGDSLGLALRNTGYDFPDIEMVELLAAVSESGKLEILLDKWGHRWLENGIKRIEFLSSLILAAGLITLYSLMGLVISGAFAMMQDMVNGF